MKKSFLIIILINSIFSHSQNLEIIYKQDFINSTFDVQHKYRLLLTDTLSVYEEIEGNAEIKENNKSYNQRTINVEMKRKKANNVYLNIKSDFYFRESFFGEQERIKEDEFKNNWKFFDSTRYISNYKCNLAMKSFRGRDYYVWYTKDIPTNFGPWKFKNLGGLILEAYDAKRDFLIYALSIKNIPKEDQKIREYMLNKVGLFKDNDELLSISDLKKLIEDKNQLILNRLKQQLPRGVAVPKLSKDCDDCNNSLEQY